MLPQPGNLSNLRRIGGFLKSLHCKEEHWQAFFENNPED